MTPRRPTRQSERRSAATKGRQLHRRLPPFTGNRRRSRRRCTPALRRLPPRTPCRT
jgi:hypothetical protein